MPEDTRENRFDAACKLARAQDYLVSSEWPKPSQDTHDAVSKIEYLIIAILEGK